MWKYCIVVVVASLVFYGPMPTSRPAQAEVEGEYVNIVVSPAPDHRASIDFHEDALSPLVEHILGSPELSVLTAGNQAGAEQRNLATQHGEPGDKTVAGSSL